MGYNGASGGGGGGVGPAGADGNIVSVSDEGTEVLALPNGLNFIGAGVTAVDDGNGGVDVTITSGGGSVATTDVIVEVITGSVDAGSLDIEGTTYTSNIDMTNASRVVCWCKRIDSSDLFPIQVDLTDTFTKARQGSGSGYGYFNVTNKATGEMTLEDVTVPMTLERVVVYEEMTVKVVS